MIVGYSMTLERHLLSMNVQPLGLQEVKGPGVLYSSPLMQLCGIEMLFGLSLPTLVSVKTAERRASPNQAVMLNEI